MLPILLYAFFKSFLRQRIPQSARLLCSLVAIPLVFLITAILVKVRLDSLPFISTVIKTMLINSFGAIL